MQTQTKKKIIKGIMVILFSVVYHYVASNYVLYITNKFPSRLRLISVRNFKKKMFKVSPTI